MSSSPGSLPLRPLFLSFEEYVYPKPTTSWLQLLSSKHQPSTHYIFVLLSCLHFFFFFN